MNHPLKIEITKKILDARPKCKAITFSATIKQAEQIGRGYLVHSGKTKKKNRMVNKSKKDKLDELESLYKDGVITESEYKESRSNIISS